MRPSLIDGPRSGGWNRGGVGVESGWNQGVPAASAELELVQRPWGRGPK